MASKRQHKESNLNLKYEALLELEKGKTIKEVSKFFNVPPKYSFYLDLMKALEDINRVVNIYSQSDKLSFKTKHRSTTNDHFMAILKIIIFDTLVKSRV